MISLRKPDQQIKFYIQMGNKIVYSTDGHFITPNRIERPKNQTNQTQINYDNVFGKINIPTARAIAADSQYNDTEKLAFSHVQHYNKSQDICSNHDFRTEKPDRILRSLDSSNCLINSQSKRQIRSQLTIKPKRYQENIQFKYSTKNNSPVKNENIQPDESYVRIFQSRHQSQYFKLTEK